MAAPPLAVLEGQVPVDTAQGLSRARMWVHRKASRRPLHLPGEAAGWRCASSWTFAALRERLDDVPVKVSKSDSGVFDYNQPESITVVEGVPFAIAVDEILERSTSGGFEYMQQHPIASTFPALLDEVQRLPWLSATNSVYDLNLWIGSAGCLTPLHYDEVDNFLVQLVGRKQLVLFPPEDTPNLYPCVGMPLPHTSYVDVRRPDYERHPLLFRTRPRGVVLQPGDVLYIPRGWWHAVQSLDASISLNYFFGGLADNLRQIPGLLRSAEGRRELWDAALSLLGSLRR